ncbi:MAG TPA: dihydrolipoamide acetyltransferase family protein [Pedobacter sp.]|jgi:2-oxoglutarate dehydrogenase E2 component (dihydrolipoamide succinyltransferase)
MPQFELILPKMGESVAEATIIKWLKQPGDQINEDEAIVEIATDKVDSDVPSPVSGKLIKYLFQENDTAQVGDVIALIDIDGDEERQPDSTETPVHEIETEEASFVEEDNIDLPIEEEIPGLAHLDIPAREEENSTIRNETSARFYSPLVKSIAAEEGLSMKDLDSITGTGAEARVTKQDLIDYISKQSEKPITETEVATTKAPTVEEPKSDPFTPRETEQAVSVDSDFSSSGNDEIIEMDRMRRLIADHMLMSVQTAPHVTSFVETDVTSIVKWREKNKASIEKKIGEKITYTPIFIQAVAKALRDFPLVNVSVNGNQIIKKVDINIGMAAALPTGNLIVPVIRKADQLNLIGLTKAVNDLANRSKTNKLQPDEVKDGTFTITNIGSFGNIMGTPIINQPQVAILAIGVIQKKPAVIETEFGDVIGVRHKMYMSLSYDHRVVDGALGGMFLKKISDYLEDWDFDYEI